MLANAILLPTLFSSVVSVSAIPSVLLFFTFGVFTLNGDGTLCGMHLLGRDKRMLTHTITPDAVHQRFFRARVGRCKNVPLRGRSNSRAPPSRQFTPNYFPAIQHPEAFRFFVGLRRAVHQQLRLRRSVRQRGVM